MSKLTTVQLRARYLILIREITDITYAKTGLPCEDSQIDGCGAQAGFS